MLAVIWRSIVPPHNGDKRQNRHAARSRAVKVRGKPVTLEVAFKVSSEHAPALKSAIEEISNIVGSRLEGSHAFAKEQALTDAAVALGALRRAITEKVPRGDIFYA